jgi:hypothetical protein
LGSSVDLRASLVAIGALRPEGNDSREPVALETAVTVTGTRPGNAGEKRELFSEETSTVLVFERGAVIRLSAAVADGQLLFLTNKSTGKEVVTQVLRKRSFRPTSCYVDLQFTESCPGFWGIEFPQMAGSQAGPGLQPPPDENSDGPAQTSAILPSIQEVEKLKQDVAALQSKPQQVLSGAGEVPAARKAAAKISSELAKREEEKRLEELFAMETAQEASQLPKRLVAYPKKSSAVEKAIIASKKPMIVAIELTILIGVLVYQFGGFAGPPKKPSLPKGTLAVAATKAASQAARQEPPPTAAAAKAEVSKAANMSTSGSVSGAQTANAQIAVDQGEIEDRTGFAGGNSAAKSVPPASKPKSVRNEAALRPRSSTAEATMNPARNHDNDTSAADLAAATAPVLDTSGMQGDYVAPKLLKGRNYVEPPEAIQNYIAGNVVMDAVVDSTGRVRSIKVVSGPAKLYQTATEVLKQYEYEPAKRNGKPMSAKVQVSLQFWYAP